MMMTLSIVRKIFALYQCVIISQAPWLCMFQNGAKLNSLFLQFN